MSLIFQETLENKPYLILNISSDPLIRYAWSRLARASSSSRWRRSFSWRRRSFSWRSCSTWARSCCNSSRTEKGTDTGSNTLIDAIAASSLHIRLDSYSASPRRKRQGSANQIPDDSTWRYARCEMPRQCWPSSERGANCHTAIHAGRPTRTRGSLEAKLEDSRPLESRVL